MHLFYSRDFSINNPVLDEKESHHAINVLRMQQHDALSITDGAGNVFIGSIAEVLKKKCIVTIHEQKPLVANPAKGFHLAVAPTKSIDRMEWMVEKCTELGIESITFLKSRYSERKEINLSKLEAVAIGAMKQSQRHYLPELKGLMSFADCLKKSTACISFIACQYDSLSTQAWAKQLSVEKNKLILIGPEGGFSEEEVILAKEHHAQAVSLGSQRLRTETAGVVACHMMNLFAQ